MEVDARKTLAHTLKGDGMIEENEILGFDRGRDVDIGTQGPKIDLEGRRLFDGGIVILDANFDLSVGLCASRIFLGIHMYFDFSFFCGSFDCIVYKRDLGTHISFEFCF